MYLFRYSRQGLEGPDPSPQCLHDRGGFLGTREDSRRLAATGKMACSPRLGWKKSAPPRTYITAVLHFKILVAVSRGSAWRSMRCATTSGTPARASEVAVVKRSFPKHVSPEAVEPRQHRVEVEFRR